MSVPNNLQPLLNMGIHALKQAGDKTFKELYKTQIKKIILIAIPAIICVVSSFYLVGTMPFVAKTLLLTSAFLLLNITEKFCQLLDIFFFQSYCMKLLKGVTVFDQIDATDFARSW